MRSLLAALLFLYATETLAGWIGGVDPEHLLSPGRAHIAYSPQQGDGASTFKEALDALARDGHAQRIEGVSLHWLVQDASFQKELMSALRESAPKELAEAFASAGNMHNPKMIQLRHPFEAAVLTTPTINQIGSELAKYGLYVSGVSTEKLSIVRSSVGRKFMCFLELQVSWRPR